MPALLPLVLTWVSVSAIVGPTPPVTSAPVIRYSALPPPATLTVEPVAVTKPFWSAPRPLTLLPLPLTELFVSAMVFSPDTARARPHTRRIRWWPRH